jgi:hypothetical protein
VVGAPGWRWEDDLRGRCFDGWREIAVGGMREEGKNWGKKTVLKILGKSCV